MSYLQALLPTLCTRMHFNSPQQAPHTLPTSSSADSVRVQIMLPLITSFSRKTNQAVHAESTSVMTSAVSVFLHSPAASPCCHHSLPRLHRKFTDNKFLRHSLILIFPGVCLFGQNNGQFTMVTVFWQGLKIVFASTRHRTMNTQHVQ